MQVAVLGMGRMGQAVAVRAVQQGHAVTVWNRTPGKAGEAVSAGATEAASPQQATAGASAVLVSLTDDRAVRAVVVESGLAAELGDAVLVDLSTVAPETSRAEAAAVPGGRMLAAPILGGPKMVHDGQATYVVAGQRRAAEELEPLWVALSDRHRWWSDDPGIASALKLLNNYLLMAGLAILGEVVGTGQGIGLGDDTLHEFLGGNPMVPAGLQNRLQDVIAGTHEGWFSTRMGAKDVKLTRELAASAGLQLPIAELVQARYEALADLGLGESDIAAVVELVRRPAG